MSLLIFHCLAIVATLTIAIIGGVWPFIKRSRQQQTQSALTELEFPIGESLACGIFLGAGLLHMLPDATRAFTQAGYTYPWSFLIASLGFLFLLFLEHLSHALESRSKRFFSQIALLTTLILSIHSLLEGAALGLTHDFITGMMIFIAIITHKGAASFALSININRGQLSRTVALIAFCIFAVMTPLGIFGGSWIQSSHATFGLASPIFMALAAGTFLYIGSLHGLDRATLIRHCCNLKEFLVMLAGFAMMAVVAIWA